MTDRASPLDESRVLCRDTNRARVLTLHRPSARNSFDEAMYRQLKSALDDSAGDDSVGCVVITGTPPAFCAGADLESLASLLDAPKVDPAYDELLRRLETFPKPLVAAVNGVAVGIGLTMLGHADMVLVARTARLRAPFGHLGLGPEAGSTWTFPRLLGRQRTAHVLFTGCWISADEAVSSGLALRVVDDDRLLDEAEALAGEVAANPLESVRATKLLLLESDRVAAQLAREREDAAFCALLATKSTRNRLEAALRRRRA